MWAGNTTWIDGINSSTARVGALNLPVSEDAVTASASWSDQIQAAAALALDYPLAPGGVVPALDAPISSEATTPVLFLPVVSPQTAEAVSSTVTEPAAILAPVLYLPIIDNE